MCVLKILPNRTEGKERKCVFCPLERTNERSHEIESTCWEINYKLELENYNALYEKKQLGKCGERKSIEKNLKTYEILLNAIEEPTHTISPIGTKKGDNEVDRY